jgi:hypothetical protein
VECANKHAWLDLETRYRGVGLSEPLQGQLNLGRIVDLVVELIQQRAIERDLEQPLKVRGQDRVDLDVRVCGELVIAEAGRGPGDRHAAQQYGRPHRGVRFPSALASILSGIAGLRAPSEILVPGGERVGDTTDAHTALFVVLLDSTTDTLRVLGRLSMILGIGEQLLQADLSASQQPCQRRRRSIVEQQLAAVAAIEEFVSAGLVNE